MYLLPQQIAAIIMLLNAFGVPASVVAEVQQDITPTATTTQQVATTTAPTVVTPTYHPPVMQDNHSQLENQITTLQSEVTTLQNKVSSSASAGAAVPQAPATRTWYCSDTGCLNATLVTNNGWAIPADSTSITCPVPSVAINESTTTFDWVCS